MKHLAAYMMLVQGGNESPSAADVKGVLAEVGIEADDERLNALISELEGKSLPELIEIGSKKLVKGGGGGGGAAPAAGGAAEEEKPAEKPKEEEVDAMEGGLDMFGGGADY